MQGAPQGPLVVLRHAAAASMLWLALPGPQGPSHAFSQFAQCFPVFHCQLYDKSTLITSPNIACDAAGQPITAMIYLYERSTAAVASTWHCSHLIVVFRAIRIPKCRE